MSTKCWSEWENKQWGSLLSIAFEECFDKSVRCFEAQWYGINASCPSSQCPFLPYQNVSWWKEFHMWGIEYPGLFLIWLGLYWARTTCGLSSICCSSALTVTEKGALNMKRSACGSFIQNGVGHWAEVSDLTSISLRTLFWTVSNKKIPPAIFKIIYLPGAASYNL